MTFKIYPGNMEQTTECAMMNGTHHQWKFINETLIKGHLETLNARNNMGDWIDLHSSFGLVFCDSFFSSETIFPMRLPLIDTIKCFLVVVSGDEGS